MSNNNKIIFGTVNGHGHLSGKINSEGTFGGTLRSSGAMSGALHNSMFNGKSAYEIAVDEGFEGTEEEWIESLKGDAATVTVGSVSPGYPISVTNSGDEHNAVLDFVIPDSTVLATEETAGIAKLYDRTGENIDGGMTQRAVTHAIDDKIANITVPTKTSDITNDSGFITITDVPEGAVASTTTPKMSGTAAVGTETAFARGDHVHPSDSTKVDKETGKGLSSNDFTDEEKDKLNALSPGGRNLILNTLQRQFGRESRPKIIGQLEETKINGTSRTTQHGIGVLSTEAYPTVGFRFGAPGSSTPDLSFLSMNGLQPGETYTLSFDCAWKVCSNAPSNYVPSLRVIIGEDYQNPGNVVETQTYIFAQGVPGVQGSARAEITFTLNENDTAMQIKINVTPTQEDLDYYSYYAILQDYIDINNLKLEKGTVATPWSPAPEDFANYINNINNINSVKYVVSNNNGWSLDTIKNVAVEGKETLFGAVSIEGIHIGDTVNIINTDITRNTIVYIKVTVTSLEDLHSFKGIAHGYEDALLINSIKSTINNSSTEEKIAVEHVDIENATLFTNGRLSQTSLNTLINTSINNSIQNKSSYYNDQGINLYIYVAAQTGDDKNDGTVSHPVKTLQKAFKLAALKSSDVRLALTQAGIYSWDAISLTCPVLHIHAQVPETIIEISTSSTQLPSYATHINLMGYALYDTTKANKNLTIRIKNSNLANANRFYMDGGHLSAENVRFECHVRANAGCANLINCEFAHAQARYGGGLWLNKCTVIDPVVSGQPAILCHTGAAVYIGTSLTINTTNTVTDALFLQQQGGTITFSPKIVYNNIYRDSSNVAVKILSGTFCIPHQSYLALQKLGQIKVSTESLITLDNFGPNLLDKLSLTSNQSNGISFTIIENNFIKANGTATTQAYYWIGKDITFQPGSYYLFGCPQEGSDSTYCIRIAKESDSSVLATDSGNGANFTINVATKCKIYIRISKNYTATNLIFIPVIVSNNRGSFSNLSELIDVNISNSLSNRQILMYNDENSKWINTNIANAIGADIHGGGRNLLLGTETSKTSAESVNNSAYTGTYAQSPYLENIDLIVNETIFTCSFDYEVIGNTADNAVIYPQFHANTSTKTNVIASNANRPDSHAVYMYVKDKPKGRYWITWKYTTGQSTGTVSTNRIRLLNATDGATVKVSNLKLEFGIIPTDWTPAPQDTNANSDGMQGVQALLDQKAPLASPALTGTPTAPTAEVGTKTTQLATTAFVDSAVEIAIGKLDGIKFSVVNALPTAGESSTVYMVLASDGSEDDVYDEYIWLSANQKFEKIGSTRVDLSDYYNKEEVDALFPKSADDVDVLNLLTEFGYTAPISDADGNVITDADNNIILG